MAVIETTLTCEVKDSFAVDAVRGAFDLNADHGGSSAFRVEIPDLSEDWKIGLIVGPSGSGKSTIAAKAFGVAPITGFEWSRDKAVIDVLADHGVKEAGQMLAAVGFGSPPAWLRPYQALSNGEKFRCDLARAILASTGLVVFDEFTSVVDRRVARIGSHAVSKAVRGRPGVRLVAVSCHYDIADWLEPDWVVDMATCQLARGRLQRPKIEIEIRRESRDAWAIFRRHHYLSDGLPPASICYVAYVQGVAAGFVSVSGTIGHVGHRRLSRIVVLPDYQGVGIAKAIRDAIAESYAAQGLRVGIGTSHPAMIRSLVSSGNWRYTGEKKGRRTQRSPKGGLIRGFLRRVMSFRYVGKMGAKENQNIGS